VSEAAAQRTVLAAVLVGGSVVIWDNIKKSGGKRASPSGKQLVAFTILAAGLALLAGVAPNIGGPLAILIVLSVIISRVGGKK